MAEEKPLTLSEAAPEVHLAEDTLRRYSQRGKIPAFKIGGRWYVSAAWVNERKTGQPLPSGTKTKERISVVGRIPKLDSVPGSKPPDLGGTQGSLNTETHHSQKMRELAAGVKREVHLPWIFDCFFAEETPGGKRLGTKSFQINITKDKKIEIPFIMGGEGEMLHLYRGLRKHLKTGGCPEVLSNIRLWEQGVGENLVKCYELLGLVTKEIEDRFNVRIPADYSGQPGLTIDFARIVCADAVQKAGGYIWVTDSWYKYEGFNLKCGAYSIYQGVSGENLKSYENAHKELRTQYAPHQRTTEIAEQRKQLAKTAAGISQQLQEFIDMERLPGRCKLCSQ